MGDEELLQALERIQKTQNRIAMTLGITMGMILIIYFFTYAMLIDRGYDGVLLFEAITSVLFIIAFFFLNRIAFLLTRLILGRRQPFAALLQHMQPGDGNVPPPQLLQRLRQREGSRLAS